MIISFFKYILAVLLSLPLLGFTQTLNIKGSVKGAPSNQQLKIYVQRYFLEDVVLIDSTEIHKDGSFNLLLAEFIDAFYVLNITGGDVLPIVLSHADSVIRVSGTYNEFKEGNARIYNSIENEATSQILPVFMVIKQAEDSIAKVIQKISYADSAYYAKKVHNKNYINLLKQEFNIYLDGLVRKYPQTFTAKSLVGVYKHPTRLDSVKWQQEFDGDRAFNHWHYFDNLNFNDEGLLYHPAFKYELGYYLENYSGEFTKDFKESVDIILSKTQTGTPVYQYLTEKLIYHFVLAGEDETVAYIEDRYFGGCADEMIANIRETAEFQRGLTVFSAIPTITFPDKTGKNISLIDIYKKHELTLVIFWKSTCPHCIDEMETIRKVRREFGTEELGVIAVSLDTDESEWKNAIANEQMDWHNLSDLKGYDSEVSEKFKIMATPTILLVNSDGILVAKNLRGNELVSTIRKMVK